MAPARLADRRRSGGDHHYSICSPDTVGIEGNSGTCRPHPVCPEFCSRKLRYRSRDFVILSFSKSRDHKRKSCDIKVCARKREGSVSRNINPTYTRSHASAGIQCASFPSHFTLQPIGFVRGTLTGFPARCSSSARSRSFTVMRDASRGLSTPRPV